MMGMIIFLYILKLIGIIMQSQQQHSYPPHEPLSLSFNNNPLTKFQLHELVHNNEKFVGTVHQLNNQAKIKIGIDRPKQALVYLNEAERILEYGANCGKNIDRNLIVCVLHNQACCHQKLWQLEKCSNYLEALIFNIQSHLNMQQSIVLEEEKDGLGEKNNFRGKSINNRIHITNYYLQFCAISSQLRNHKEALSSGKQAINIVKTLFMELHQIFLNQKQQLHQQLIAPGQTKEEFSQKVQTIQGLSLMNDEPLLQCLEDYLQTAKHYLKIWNKNKEEQTNDQLKQSLKNFSIGSVMQMKSISFEQNKQSTLDNDNLLQLVLEETHQGNPLRIQTYQTILNKVLLLSISYFAIATELRLIANERSTNDEEKSTSSEYKESEIYHLISLIIGLIYVPFDTLYIKHILASFSNNYHIDLGSDKFVPSVGKVRSDLFVPKAPLKLSHLPQSKVLSFQYTSSLKLKSEDQLNKSKQESNCYPVVKVKRQASLSCKSQQKFSVSKRTKNQRTKSQFMDRLKSCLTPRHYEKDKKKTITEKSPHKTKSQKKILKKVKSLTERPKKKLKKQEKEKDVKGEYFNKVCEKRKGFQQTKKLKMTLDRDKVKKLKGKPDSQSKKILKKKIDRYYF